MKFRSYDALRVFNIAASTMSFTQAARRLNLTKGAVSYQIKRLEEDLGFAVFYRSHGGVTLTDQGKKVLQISQSAFNLFESQLSQIKKHNQLSVTVGMSTYFASRWLTSRLMSFTAVNSNFSLRLQPMIDPIDVTNESIDMAIRWGNGNWSDMNIELLFICPAIATGGKIIATKIKKHSLNEIVEGVTLLHDRDNSQAWKQWHDAANLPYRPNRNDLVIPDPNVRVEAVINGQGLALNDSLINDEINQGKLFKISNTVLEDYGYYLAYRDEALENPALKAFRDWILEAASNYKCLNL